LEGKRNDQNNLGVTASDVCVLRLCKDGDGFDLNSDGFPYGPEQEHKVPDEVRGGNSLNKISAGEFSNRRLWTG